MSDRDRGIPPGWTSYMEADAEGGVSEVLRRDPLYASRELAWADHDRLRLELRQELATDGAAAVLLAFAALVGEGLAEHAKEMPQAAALSVGTGAQMFVDAAAVFLGKATALDPFMLCVIERFRENCEQIWGELE